MGSFTHPLEKGELSLCIPKVSPVVSGPSATRVLTQPSGFLDRMSDIQFSENVSDIPGSGMPAVNYIIEQYQLFERIWNIPEIKSGRF